MTCGVGLLEGQEPLRKDSLHRERNWRTPTTFNWDGPGLDWGLEAILMGFWKQQSASHSDVLQPTIQGLVLSPKLSVLEQKGKYKLK